MSQEWFVGARVSDGRALGVEPRFKDEVYVLPKNEIGGWERLRLTKHDGGKFDLYFVDSGVQLSINDSGGYETRPAGTFGPWEMFDAAESPDGVFAALWRTKDNRPIGTVVLELAP